MSNQHQQQSGESDNYTNTMTERHVESAIEMGLQSRQETYREFMDSFLHLTDEDVKKYEEAKIKKELEKLALSKHAQQSLDDEETQTKGETPKPGKPPPALKLDNVKGRTASDDELETEELGEGTYSPRCTDEDKFGGGKKFVQVDNFVEDSTSSDVSSDEDDIIDYGVAGGGYVSSFGQVDVSNQAAVDVSKQTNANVSKQTDLDADVDKEEEQTSISTEEAEAEPRMISPLPGEAEDNPIETEIDVHQTQLDMCVKGIIESTDEPGCEQTESEEVTNEVQPFSLDDNFDYDNVVLSKKWDLDQRPPNLPP